MTIPFARASLQLALGCLVGGVVCAQDVATAPALKMGLWETTETSTISGITYPPDLVDSLRARGRPLPGSPETIVLQTCYTKEEWAKSVEKWNNNDAKCTHTNRSFTSTKFAFDLRCASDPSNVITGHFEMLVDDDEHTHGSIHMKSETGPNGRPTTHDTISSSHFVASDCGVVKPGTPKIIKSQ
jgi:hypothetical protein